MDRRRGPLPLDKLDEATSNLCQQLMYREAGGRVQGSASRFTGHLFRERLRLAKNLYKTDLEGHFGCVNAIEFSNGGKFLASGGDDKRVLLWDVEKAMGLQAYEPRVLNTQHSSNIFSLCFDRTNEKLLSGGNDDLVIAHDFETGKLLNMYKYDSPVYGISIDPQSRQVFATAFEDGRILINDLRTVNAVPMVLAQTDSSFHAVEFHPIDGNHLVTANSKKGPALWDVRKPHHPLLRYGYSDNPPSCMSVRFSTNGTLILALSRRMPPILYNSERQDPVCTFFHGNYYNSCTMKSCTFAGENDELVLSGSDDFNLYVWRLSDVNLDKSDQWVEHTQMVLYGHRSIVNQVRYNRQKCLLASSGVEKIVKLWSPFKQNKWTGSLLTEATCSDNPRVLYTPYNYNSPSAQYLSQMSHDDYSNRNTSEDPRMMAFFDSLIQQEIEGWNTGESTESELSPTFNSIESSSSDDDDSDNDRGPNPIAAGVRNVCRLPPAAGRGAATTARGATNGTGGRGAGRSRLGRRLIRNLVRKKNRKRRNSAWRKVKLVRHKYQNRIAYLIATKRNHLRKLAIRDAALNNRRLCRVGGGTVPGTVSETNGRRSETPCCSTSKPSSSGRRRQAARRNLGDANDSSTDDDDDDAGPSSRKNDDQTQVPSTSTGITSSLKDELIRFRRLQQQLTDSDDDDDDDDDDNLGHSQSQNAINRVFQQSASKTNGVLKRLEETPARRFPNRNVSEDSSSSSGSSNSRRALPSSASSHDVNRVPPYRPTGLIGARALSRYPKHLSKQLPQSSGSRSSSSQQQHLQPHHGARPMAVNFEDDANQSGSSSRMSLTNNEESESNSDGDTAEDNEAADGTSSSSQTSSSETTSSSESTSDSKSGTNTNTKQQQQHAKAGESTPIKRKTAKMDGAADTGDEGRAKKKMKKTASNDNHPPDPKDEEAASSTMTRRGQNGSTSAAASIACTPDSGVSMGGPHTSEEKASTSAASRLRVSPGRHRRTANEIFQRKVAGVKRNYRKHFSNDSDSD